jgi:hypothetical protein
VKRLSEAERDGLALEAQKRSGSDIVLEYPVPAAGIYVYLCRLGNDDFRDVVDGLMSGDKARRETGRNVALAAARLAPSQRELADACAAVPDLDIALWGAVERLGGGNAEFLQVVDVRPTLDASAVSALGIDPTRLDALRKLHPHPGQLKIASYRDDELDITWACVLKLPGSQATRLMLEGMAERGHETAATFAVNSIVEPGREQAASFVRGEHRVASCLWPALFTWAKTAAAARPTILRPRSTPSATLTPPQT